MRGPLPKLCSPNWSHLFLQYVMCCFWQASLWCFLSLMWGYHAWGIMYLASAGSGNSRGNVVKAMRSFPCPTAGCLKSLPHKITHFAICGERIPGVIAWENKSTSFFLFFLNISSVILIYKYLIVSFVCVANDMAEAPTPLSLVDNIEER